MKRKECEYRIKRAFEQCTPNVFENVKAAETIKMTEEDYIISQSKYKKKNIVNSFKYAFTVAVIAVMVFAVNIINYNSVASLIAIDVNPSIEITANKNDNVLSVKALNYEAEKVIGDMKLKNVDLNVAVNAIIGSLFKNGYIAEAQNSILVSVVNDDDIKANEIKSNIVNDINISLEKNNIKATVFNQQISNHESQNSNLEVLAKKYNISIGKMFFINSIVEKDNSFNIDELVNMPIKKIADIAGSKNINLHDFVEYEDVIYKEDIYEDNGYGWEFNHNSNDGHGGNCRNGNGH